MPCENEFEFWVVVLSQSWHEPRIGKDRFWSFAKSAVCDPGGGSLIIEQSSDLFGKDAKLGRYPRLLASKSSVVGCVVETADARRLVKGFVPPRRFVGIRFRFRAVTDNDERNYILVESCGVHNARKCVPG